MALGKVDENGYFWHHCPGCDNTHIVPVVPTAHFPSVWGYNGNLDAPTLTPSVKHTWPVTKGGERTGADHCCHYHITDGRIAYCADSTHALAGVTTDLAVWA